jgi:uncharacterized damage-inducible protein DinB
MNDVTLYMFRHNTWATLQLLDFCKQLSPDELQTAGVGTYDNILETFNHIAHAETNYLQRLSGNTFDWLAVDETLDLERLKEKISMTFDGWKQYLSREIDPEEVYYVDDGEYAVRAGIIITQAIHHGNHHREQICAILTGLGYEPPDIQSWEYAWDTGQIWKASSS